MFHLAKRTTLGATSNSLLCKHVAATTGVDNIKTTVFMDRRRFIVPCPCKSDGLVADGQPL